MYGRVTKCTKQEAVGTRSMVDLFTVPLNLRPKWGLSGSNPHYNPNLKVV